MFKYVFVYVFLLFSGTVYAQGQDCGALKLKKEDLIKRSDTIMKTYKDEVQVFGYSPRMILQTNFEDAGETILRMAGLVKGCNVLADKANCQIVSKEVISLISSGSSLCRSDKKLNCGICN